jgi:hypothetical protein
MTWNEFVQQALLIGNLTPRNQSVEPVLNQDGRTALTFLLSEWSRDGLLTPSTSATEATLVPGQNIYTVGAAGDFTSRPVKITQAILFDGSLNEVRMPIEVIDWDEFEALTFPTAQGLPKQCSVNYSYPQLQVGLYPTPNTNYKLRLVGQFPWSAVVFSDQVVLPPGYDSAILDNLAVKICQNYNREVPQWLMLRARDGKSSVIMDQPPLDTAKDNIKAQRYRSTRVRNWLSDSPS